MIADDLRGGLNALWGNMAEGWKHLRQSASSAMTRFRPESGTQLPGREKVDDPFYLPGLGWAMLGADVFEDQDRIVVRIEIPGMSKQDLRVDISGGALIVSGEKRFAAESGEGRWRSIQRAYGSFKRAVPLPAEVRQGDSRASYENGVLRVELMKLVHDRPSGSSIPVD